MASTMIGTRKQVLGWCLPAICGAIVAAVAVTGTGMWRGGEQRPPAVAAGGDQVSGIQETAAIHRAVQPNRAYERPTVFLVATLVQMHAVRKDIQEENAVRWRNGEALLDGTVLVTTSTQEHARIREQLAHIRSSQQSLGIPVLDVVDLVSGADDLE
jgi:hypothetical protein